MNNYPGQGFGILLLISNLILTVVKFLYEITGFIHDKSIFSSGLIERVLAPV